MGNKSELTVALLLIAALCLNALITNTIGYLSGREMTWLKARLYCQKNHIDMLTFKRGSKLWLADWMLEKKIPKVWIGLLRDPEQDLVWKWIDEKTGEGISGNDLSLSSNWADGQQSGHCALVQGSDRLWYSNACSSEHNFYCSSQGVNQHIKMNLSWYEAQQYCRREFDDLATVTRETTDQFNNTGWIGLYREGGETWSWSGDLTSDYRNWASGQPLTEDCAFFDTVTQKWHSEQCSEKLRFVCYDDYLEVVKENKTWEEALEYCNSMDRQRLMSLKYDKEYKYARDRIYKATTDEVWTGLRFLGGEWWWLGGQMLDHQGMLPTCQSQQKHCGTLSKYDTNKWLTRDCSERRNFVCHKYKVKDIE
ncbi:macrophage mannose receptor 1-like [Scomber scombrus]|uniref:Macrophage mannose receptor 1-like n=1 Tax=Scomber scombrus TaxID=13677 RepID=A0AAV1N5F3_SCOSC